MKKTLVLLIALLLVISLTSCGQKETVSTDLNSDISSKIQFSEQENTSSTISKEEETVNRITESMKLDTTATAVYRNFSEIGKIVDIFSVPTTRSEQENQISYVITEEGKLYRISFIKPFQSGDYFEEVFSKSKIIKFLPQSNESLSFVIYLLSEEKNVLCYIIDSKSIEECSLDMYEGDIWRKGIIDACGTSIESITKIVPYSPRLYFFRNNTMFDYNSYNLVTLPEDEKIEFVIEGAVKTNKGWYTLKEVQTNEEECEQYAGVKPVYGWQLVKMDFGDDIILAKEILTDTYCAVTIDNTVYIVG